MEQKASNNTINRKMNIRNFMHFQKGVTKGGLTNMKMCMTSFMDNPLSKLNLVTRSVLFFNIKSSSSITNSLNEKFMFFIK